MTEFKGHNHGEYDDECPICYLDREVERLSSEDKIMREALTKIKDSKLTPTKHWIYSIDLAIQALTPVSEGLSDD